MSTTNIAPHSVSGPITPTDALAFWHTVRSEGISTLSPGLLALGIVGFCEEGTLCENCGCEIATGLDPDEPEEALGTAARIDDGAVVCPACGKAYPIELGSLITEEEAELLGLPILRLLNGAVVPTHRDLVARIALHQRRKGARANVLLWQDDDGTEAVVFGRTIAAAVPHGPVYETSAAVLRARRGRLAPSIGEVARVLVRTPGVEGQILRLQAIVRHAVARGLLPRADVANVAQLSKKVRARSPEDGARDLRGIASDLELHVVGGDTAHLELRIELHAFRQGSEAESPGSRERPASRRER